MAGDARDSPPSPPTSEAEADEAVRSVLEQRGLEQTLEKLGFGESSRCFCFGLAAAGARWAQCDQSCMDKQTLTPHALRIRTTQINGR